MRLVNKLKEVKDNRKGQGKKYPISALLSLLVLSRLCGYQDIKSAWHLCRNMHYRQLQQLGFKNHYRPSYPVFTKSLNQVDVISLEKVLSNITGEDFGSLSGITPVQLSMDGKCLSGRKTESGDAFHLVSLFCNQLNSVYAQVKSKIGGGEIHAALRLVKDMDITGKVITGDAIYANAKLCKEITNKEGDYVFTVKSNQQELRHQILQVFRLNPWPDTVGEYSEEITKAHGRLEKRSIRVLSGLGFNRRDGFDTIKQLAEITRYRYDLNNDKGESTEKVYIITSLSSKQASPKQLLEYNRNHWAIENNLHRTRDTLFAEDKQTIRTGSAPQASSALSNLAIKLLKKAQKKHKGISLQALTQLCARKIAIPIELIA